ncbi:MAG: hypothetical protein KF873_00885 [Gemmataceae bacterium]|nr:hypothetical protein [Planctomycetia bacterium]MBX3397267.1 hypothetical protein [Gemmataceae bacterium]
MTGTTLLLRQIHPAFVQNGFPTSQAFRPTPKDESHLSIYDGDRIDATAAWSHYTTVLQLSSVGTMAITVEECTAEGLPARSDPEPFPEHAIIDFSGLTDKECQRKGKKLQVKAVARGWLHRVN